MKDGTRSSLDVILSETTLIMISSQMCCFLMVTVDGMFHVHTNQMNAKNPSFYSLAISFPDMNPAYAGRNY